MKSRNLKLLTLVATLAIAATTASAQVPLRATIPFSFEVTGHYALPAGNYVVNRNGNVWTFTNQEKHSGALAQATAPTESRLTDSAKLKFECRADTCTLREIQTGGGEIGGYWAAPRLSKSDAQELARLVIVPLTPSAE